jgi:hypothetical protein
MGSAINTAYGPGTPLEVSQTFTPLGIRFWDLTQNLPISDGLAVSLRLGNSNAPALQAVLTQSGVYAFFGLHGLYAAEHPSPVGYGPPRTFRYVVTVQDSLGRYLPAVLVYTLDQTGTVLVQGSPDTTPGARVAQLFSSVSRPVPVGVGAIRAELLDRDTNQPAAWAVIRVTITGESETWTGIADEAGRVLVLVPYPVMQVLQLGSPPGTGQGSITAQSWPVTVEAQYNPDLLSYPAADFQDAQWPWTDTPSLRDILCNQPTAAIWPNPATPAIELTANLNFGQDLVLSSASGSPPSPDSTLSISRGGSPP